VEDIRKDLPEECLFTISIETLEEEALKAADAKIDYYKEKRVWLQVLNAEDSVAQNLNDFTK
jgi:hypothetical protein